MDGTETATGNANTQAKESPVSKSGRISTYAIVAVLVAILGICAIGGWLPFVSLSSASSVATNSVVAASAAGADRNQDLQGAVQEINMTVDNGWVPSSFVVKTGVPVRWNVYVKRFGGCINGLRSTDLGINWQFQTIGETRTFEFTPSKAGTMYFSCLMNMATGRIEVRDDVTVSGAAATNAAAATNPVQRTGGCGCGGSSGTCGLR